MGINFINREQLEKLWEKINEYNIPLDCIKNLINVKYMSDMTVQQYNYLLLIIYQVESKYND